MTGDTTRTRMTAPGLSLRTPWPRAAAVPHGKVRFDGRDMHQANNLVARARCIPTEATVAGMAVYLTVLHNQQVQAHIPYEIPERRRAPELNFGDVGVDDDRLPDGWKVMGVPRLDRITREMSCTVKPDLVEPMQQFAGQGSYDGRAEGAKPRWAELRYR